MTLSPASRGDRQSNDRGNGSPLSNLAITLFGGTLSLDSNGGIPPGNALTFNNAVTVAQSSTIEAQSGNIIYTLGSALGINVFSGQTLTLNPSAAIPSLARPLSDPGAISGFGNLQTTSVRGESVHGRHDQSQRRDSFTGTTNIAGSNVVLGTATRRRC